MKYKKPEIWMEDLLDPQEIALLTLFSYCNHKQPLIETKVTEFPTFDDNDGGTFSLMISIGTGKIEVFVEGNYELGFSGSYRPATRWEPEEHPDSILEDLEVSNIFVYIDGTEYEVMIDEKFKYPKTSTVNQDQLIALAHLAVEEGEAEKNSSVSDVSSYYSKKREKLYSGNATKDVPSKLLAKIDKIYNSEKIQIMISGSEFDLF